MSIDPSFPVSTPDADTPTDPTSSSLSRLSRSEQDQWKKLRKRVSKRALALPPSKVLGESAKSGRVYRWGLANANGGPCPRLVDVLSRLAVDEPVSKKQSEQIDFSLVVESFCDEPIAVSESTVDHVMSVLWAAAMPGLIDRMETRLWWDLLGRLQHICERFRHSDDESSPAKLILAGELGLTLAWRLTDLPSCQRLREPSVRAIKQWLRGEGTSIASAVQGVATARLNLASLVRCDDLLNATTKRSLSKRQRAIAADLATWVGGLTNVGGASVFLSDNVDAPEVRSNHRYLADDDASLLSAATRFDPETLKPAIQAALGVTQTGGRLAWEVCLPESLIHCENAKVAVMMPEWDVRRGRTIVDYGQEDCRVELHAGRAKAFRGKWQAMISIDGEEQTPQGPWESTCEFSDDDVHYLEIEQEWTGGVTLQRQFLVVRDDRCVLLCDNVLTDEADPSVTNTTRNGSVNAAANKPPSIQYTSRIPLTPELIPDPEKETREIYFRDPTGNLSPKSKGAKKKKKSASMDHSRTCNGKRKREPMRGPRIGREGTWRLAPGESGASGNNPLIRGPNLDAKTCRAGFQPVQKSLPVGTLRVPDSGGSPSSNENRLLRGDHTNHASTVLLGRCFDFADSFKQLDHHLHHFAAFFDVRHFSTAKQDTDLDLVFVREKLFGLTNFGPHVFVACLWP